MKKRTITTMLLASIVAIGTATYAEEKTDAAAKAEVKKQTVCPVMGGKINKEAYVDVQGKRIYVCCAGCIAKIKADPDKYIKQMESEGITLEKAPEKDKAEAVTEESTDSQQ